MAANKSIRQGEECVETIREALTSLTTLQLVEVSVPTTLMSISDEDEGPELKKLTLSWSR